ncbi:MAG: tetratricopeptide repeat protein [Bacteroidota bacterium]
MKLVLILYLIINPINDLDKIAKINKAKKEAEQAYLAKNYTIANEKYLYLRDSLGVKEDKLLLNLANTQYLLNDSISAQKTYNELINSENNIVSSLAHQQLGAMEFKNQKYKEALEHYKSALKKAPDNQDARYNYELLKKLVKEQEEQQQDQQNQDKENNDQQNKDQEKQDQQDKNEENKDQEQQEENKEEENKDQQNKEEQDQQQQDKEEQEKKDQQSEEQKKEDEKKQEQPNSIDEEKLKEMKISEEKARLILEAMKNNEVQYIQQNKRKAKKKKDPNKPDW